MSLLRLDLGPARTLTKDCLCGPYVEIQIFQSRSPEH
jgi:hypothetical protein